MVCVCVFACLRVCVSEEFYKRPTCICEKTVHRNPPIIRASPSRSRARPPPLSPCGVLPACLPVRTCVRSCTCLSIAARAGVRGKGVRQVSGAGPRVRRFRRALPQQGGAGPGELPLACARDSSLSLCSHRPILLAATGDSTADLCLGTVVLPVFCSDWMFWSAPSQEPRLLNSSDFLFFGTTGGVCVCFVLFCFFRKLLFWSHLLGSSGPRSSRLSRPLCDRPISMQSSSCIGVVSPSVPPRIL